MKKRLQSSLSFLNYKNSYIIIINFYIEILYILYKNKLKHTTTPDHLYRYKIKQNVECILKSFKAVLYKCTCPCSLLSAVKITQNPDGKCPNLAFFLPFLEKNPAFSAESAPENFTTAPDEYVFAVKTLHNFIRF